MKRVIIDCDPSADDALALMLAAASAELSLEAVTAVSGVCEVAQSAQNALNILELCGRSDVSVAAGASQPLKRRLEFDGKNTAAVTDFRRRGLSPPLPVCQDCLPWS